MTSTLSYFDAHCHLQDERLTALLPSILAEYAALGVKRVVVNGTCEADWPKVSALAASAPGLIRPSYGLHPWFVNQRSPQWQERLAEFLDEDAAGIGEIGLDKWIHGYDLEAQKEVFRWQWTLAVERGLPVSIHCLRAWGTLLALLREAPSLAPRGFLLHSFAGPKDMIAEFVGQGAYFSISGYFFHERKRQQLETFLAVPLDRLLIETDAPDMSLPLTLDSYHVQRDGISINHPANLLTIYRETAALLGLSEDQLAAQVSENIDRLFGSARSAKPMGEDPQGHFIF